MRLAEHFNSFHNEFNNRGVSHYRILPVSRDIGWPVQQLDYFRYIKQHILTIELLYIGYNKKKKKNGN